MCASYTPSYIPCYTVGIIIIALLSIYNKNYEFKKGVGIDQCNKVAKETR